MNEIVKALLFMVSCVLTHNFIFSRFLGCCPFLGVSNRVETAFGMGMAVTFVMGLASLFTYMAYHWVLIPLELDYLSTIAFILIIASLEQVVEIFLKKSAPALYSALGIYLPLITTNCAVLGVCILNIGSPTTLANGMVVEYNLVYSVLNGVFGALGFLLAIVLMAGVRERLESAKIPKPMRGFSISLIIAGLMSIAFMGFNGLV